MKDALSALTPETLRKGIAYGEAEPVKLIRHRGDRAPLTLEAQQCQSAATTGTAVCRNGSIRDGSTEVAFQEATYDGEAWTITRAGKGE